MAAILLLEALLLQENRDRVADAMQGVLDVVAEKRALANASEALLKTLTEEERALLERRFALPLNVSAELPAPDATLATRDGRVVGNAVVTRVEGDLVFARTDYGDDVGPLTAAEVDALWRVGPLSPEHRYAAAGRALAEGLERAREELVERATRQTDLLRDLSEALDGLLGVLGHLERNPAVAAAAGRCRDSVAAYVKKITKREDS